METITSLMEELEAHHNQEEPDSHRPISENSLLELQNLFNDGNGDQLWEEMASKNVPLASLVHSITATIDSNSRIAVLASEVYLSILVSQSSPVYTLFTPISFQSLLRFVRRSLKQRSNSPAKGNCRKTQKKKCAGRNSRRVRDEEIQEGEIDEDMNEKGVVDVKDLLSVLERLLMVLDRLHLNGYPDSLKSLVETVAEIPVMALEFDGDEMFGFKTNKVRKLSESFAHTIFDRLSKICFRILYRILQPEHGDQSATAVEVLKSLSPAILLLKSQVRLSALRFVTSQMMPMAKDNAAIRKTIVYLPRYLSAKAPEKSEPRAMAVDSILVIVQAMETEDQVDFANYVVKMTQGKLQLRLVAIDLVLALLGSLPDPLGVREESRKVDRSWGSRCLEALMHRCSDIVPVIRARALTNMAQAVETLSADTGNWAQLREILGFGISEKEANWTPSLELGSDPNKSSNRRAGCRDLNVLLRRRCMDDKAAVRKAALLLITKSTALLGKSVDEVMLKTIGVACSDPLVSIRKAAVSALSEILRKFPDSKVTTEWLHSVPQLIMDNESSIQEECENLFLELILDRVLKAPTLSSSSNRSKQPGTDFKGNSDRELELVFPGVLVLLKGICDGDVAPSVKKICTSIGKKGQLKASIALSLQNIIATSEALWMNKSSPIEKWTAPPGAWFLLSEISVFLPKVVAWKFLHHYWQLLDKSELENKVCSPLTQQEMANGDGSIKLNSVAWAEDRVFLLQTISNVAMELPPEPAAELAHNLLKRIEAFNMHPTEVDAHVKALRTLCKRKATSPEEGERLVSKWVNQVLTKALEILGNYVSDASESSKFDSFRTPPKSGSRKGKKGATVFESSSQAVTVVFTVGSLVLVCPSADLKGIIPLLQAIVTSGSFEPKAKQLPGLSVLKEHFTPSLYIQSWLTMGKICLTDGKLAKRYIPLFVQELEKSDSAALRNNIVVVMTDFCVRYTALVDCYIPRITKSLRDPCEVVRRQTFVLLSRLLQRDYVKWRGVLFHRFLLSLVDESEKIRKLADFLFGSILKTKAPLLAYNSFVEAIFLLNDCNAHSGHGESQGLGRGNRLFSLRGNDEKSRSQRMHIYVSLLKQMSPEQLLATSAKLCAEILAAASDDFLDLNSVTGQSVLQDALQILACKEMRIQPNRGFATAAATDATEMDDEVGNTSAGALLAARGRVVSQVAKKSLIQNAIPIFIELKRLLESKNSPLTGCLMECLRIMLKDYKNEIDDILVADKQLQKELIYDMQKYETAKAKSAVAEAVASIQRTGGYRSTASHGSGVSKFGEGDGVPVKLAEKLGTAKKLVSAVGDVAAEAVARSVLKDVNRGVSTPPLHSMGMPKLKSATAGCSRDRAADVLESLRRRQSFSDSDEEN